MISVTILSSSLPDIDTQANVCHRLLAVEFINKNTTTMPWAGCGTSMPNGTLSATATNAVVSLTENWPGPPEEHTLPGFGFTFTYSVVLAYVAPAPLPKSPGAAFIVFAIILAVLFIWSMLKWWKSRASRALDATGLDMSNQAQNLDTDSKKQGETEMV